MSGRHIFGLGAFSMPVFSSPTIPVIAAGRLGPSFNERPTPAGFPGASVRGFGGVMDWFKTVGGVATDAASLKIRQEAGAGAEATVRPLVMKAMIVSGVGITLSVVAIFLSLRKR